MLFLRRCTGSSGKYGVGGALIAVASAVLVAGQGVAVGATAKKKLVIKEVQGEARVLHALNRLTFGPRPGDVAAVQAMGIDRWFEQQLNPASVDDSALEARLVMFPAMKLQQADLMRRFPNPGVL